MYHSHSHSDVEAISRAISILGDLSFDEGEFEAALAQARTEIDAERAALEARFKDCADRPQTPLIISPMPPALDDPFDKPIEAPKKLPTEYALHFHGEVDDRPLQSWLAEGMLPEVGQGLLPGQWGVYKSFVALDLAGAVMTKGSFAGRKITRQAAALFVACEGQSEMRVRLEAIAREKVSKAASCDGVLPVDSKQMPFSWIESCPRLTGDGALDVLRRIVRAAAEKMQARFGLPIGLIIIDTMSAAAGFRDANDTAETQRVMDLLGALAKEAQAFVLVVDHFGKDASTGTRNSSAKEGGADSVIAILGEKDMAGNVSKTRLAIRKVRGAPTGQEIPFTMREVAVYENAGHDSVTSLVVDWEEPAGGSTASEASRTRRMSDGTTIALRALRKTIAEVGEQRIANDIPRGIRGATVEQWRTRSYLAGICDSDELKTRQKAFKRAREALLADGTVVEWNGFVWIAKD